MDVKVISSSLRAARNARRSGSQEADRPSEAVTGRTAPAGDEAARQEAHRLERFARSAMNGPTDARPSATEGGNDLPHPTAVRLKLTIF